MTTHFSSDHYSELSAPFDSLDTKGVNSTNSIKTEMMMRNNNDMYGTSVDSPKREKNSSFSSKNLQHAITQQSIPHQTTGTHAPVKLIQIRLDCEVNGMKLRDAFTWNVHEAIVTPEQFAELLVDEIECASSPAREIFNHLAPQIAISIHQQSHHAITNGLDDAYLNIGPMAGDSRDNGNPNGCGIPGIEKHHGILHDDIPNCFDLQNELEMENIRVLIKLDLNLGPVHLRDQFEWPLFTTNGPRPDEFATQLTSALSISNDYAPIIAHAIREQICLSRINYEESGAAGDNGLAGEGSGIGSHQGGVGGDIEHQVNGHQGFRGNDNEWSNAIDQQHNSSEKETKKSRKSKEFTNSYSTNPGTGGHNGNFNQWRTMMNNNNVSQQQRIPYRNYTPTVEEQATFQQFSYHTVPSLAGGNGVVGQQGQYFQNTFTGQGMCSGGSSIQEGSSGDREMGGNHHHHHHHTNGPHHHPHLKHEKHEKHLNTSSSSSKKEKRKPRDPPVADPELVAKQIELMEGRLELQNLDCKVEMGPDGVIPPKKHRGFGASANMFNADGNIDVGEFRQIWRCSWCLLSGRYTPTLRKGPLGSKTLCNACGIWYSKHGSLPQDRYQENLDCV